MSYDTALRVVRRLRAVRRADKMADSHQAQSAGRGMILIRTLVESE